MKAGKMYTLSILLLLLTVTVFATRRYFSGNLCIYISTQRYPFDLGTGTLDALTTTANGQQCTVTDAAGMSFPLYYQENPVSEYPVVPVYHAGSW